MNAISRPERSPEPLMILGVYHPARGVGHDTGVALVDDRGRPVVALSEERFSRVKMDGGFPFRALEALWRATGVTAADLRAVAVPYLDRVSQLLESARLAAAAVGDPPIAWRQVANRLAGDFFQRRMAAIGAYDYLEDYKDRLRQVRDATDALT